MNVQNEQIDTLIQQLLEQRRIPRATYRIQFNEQFTFRDALALVPYLHDLGISDLYASPIFKSRSGSTHGYDICDHSQFSPVLGTADAFDALSAALHDRGMGLILDTVPNHMGIGDPCNAWWMDVLENGPGSAYADYFDIDWQPIKPELENKVLIPILEDQYGKVLESGKFRLAYEDGAFFLYYYENKLPITPRTYSLILSYRLDALIETLGADNEQLQELQSILTALSHLPSRTEQDPAKRTERQREKEVIKRRIAALVNSSPAVQTALNETVQDFNGTIGDPHSFDLLDNLIDAQPYRPAFWRVAAEEINYRRFFDINDLAAIRVERPEVFQDTHRLIFKLLSEGKVNGLRIDHPDGLWNPPHYFYQLQEGYIADAVKVHLQTDDPAVTDAVIRRLQEQNNDEDVRNWPLYVVVEKILSETEPLPQEWAVYGTTGYDFMSAVTGLFVDSNHQPAFDGIYHRFIKDHPDFPALIVASKQMTMENALSSEINALAYQLERINEKNRRYRDFTLNGIITALREVIASMAIYRTYISDPHTISERDQRYIEAAVAAARWRNPQIAGSLFYFIRNTLLLRNMDEFREEHRQDLIAFVMKFQQVTGPVMAKSVEDTAFYIYNRLVSLNEVGGEPQTFGTSIKDFHGRNRERLRCWPHSMLASSTHDTKRTEDVRARISVLSEIPGEWNAGLARWKRSNGNHRTLVDGSPAPDRNEEYLFYQIVIGAWPFEPTSPEEFATFRERIAAYMLKAAKEAKVHTGWINPNQAYDDALQNFVRAALDEKTGARFLADMGAFQRRIAYYGMFNGLSQQLLKLTSPGVPDIYQGTELWDLSLVDPDNRRPVDYQRRTNYLTGLQAADGDRAALVQDLLDRAGDGRIKLYVTSRALAYRREHPQVFRESDYVPLEASGDKRDHVIAFSRRYADESLIVVVPRLIAELVGGVERPPLGDEVWGNTAVTFPAEYAGRAFRNLFTDEIVTVNPSDQSAGLPLSILLTRFPVALLVQV